MAKQRHQDAQKDSSRNTILVMAVGAVLVAALVGWALTRTVDTSTVTTAEGYTQPPNATAGSTPGSAPPIAETPTVTSTGMPMPSTSAPLSLPPSGPVGDRATVTRIAAEDLRDQINAGAVTVVDVRDANSFAASHIPGSIHIPFASMEGMVDTIPKGKPIVTYCT
jgi:Rhodanese-like domain